MTDLIVACVRTGTKYSIDYVVKLRNMVNRHLHQPYRMVCLTDQPDRCGGVHFIDISAIGLNGWWAKMLLFEPQWRGLAKVIYLDLDTVLIRDIGALAAVPGELAICENFTRLLTNPDYPCKYNSSVMVIGGGMGQFIWFAFNQNGAELMKQYDRHGDQRCIEYLYPAATLLQNVLPKGFFCNYRQLTSHVPKSPAAIINFGGNNKPDNCPIPWLKEAWS
jgi:hypothetical protein